MFKLDFIDHIIIEFIKNLPKTIVPLKFTGELVCINSYIQGVFFMMIVGEILVAIFKVHGAKKKVKLFGRSRND